MRKQLKGAIPRTEGARVQLALATAKLLLKEIGPATERQANEFCKRRLGDVKSVFIANGSHEERGPQNDCAEHLPCKIDPLHQTPEAQPVVKADHVQLYVDGGGSRHVAWVEGQGYAPTAHARSRTDCVRPAGERGPSGDWRRKLHHRGGAVAA